MAVVGQYATADITKVLTINTTDGAADRHCCGTAGIA